MLGFWSPRANRFPSTRSEATTIEIPGTQPSHLSEVRLLIADARKLFRQGLISLFTTELGILVVGDTDNGEDGIKLMKAKKPQVVVLNIELPGLDGIAVARRLHAELKSPPRLVFLANAHNETRMREAFHAGARSYLLQGCDFKELVFAVRKVACGEYYLAGPAGRELVLEYLTPRDQRTEGSSLLTPRETEMARLLADGSSTKEAAHRLGISVKTAETHRATIMKKLDAKNVTDVVKYCIRNGIVTT